MNRLLIALIKMETAEQTIHFTLEAIELHGGNGYIEDFVTPKLLRDAQVLTVLGRYCKYPVTFFVPNGYRAF
nr:acyl-CoA dehydrogenase family protein [Peribacillus saganii]